MNINDIMVKDNVDFTQKYTSGFEFSDDNAGELDLSELPIEIDIADIDQYPNKEYALLRKNGLGIFADSFQWTRFSISPV